MVLYMKSNGFLSTNFSESNILNYGNSGSDLHLNRYFLYTLLPTGFFHSAWFSSLAKTYSFAIFGEALAGAKRKFTNIQT